MTILQLDSVNVLCRSHFLPFFARLGTYDRDRLDEWLWRSGDNHEFLAHQASITSVDSAQAGGPLGVGKRRLPRRLRGDVGG